VLVHFRAELRDRVEAACGRHIGAVGGRPGLVVEVGHKAGKGSSATAEIADGLRDAKAGVDGTEDAGGPRPAKGIAPARLP
jgi:hypothetical protein